MRAQILDSIATIDAAAWDACFPGEAEAMAYYTACEMAARLSGRGVRVGAVCVEDEQGVVAVAPTFRLDYRLDTPLQGSLRSVGDALFRTLPRLVTLKVLCVGSPYAERCHIGLAPRLDDAGRIAAFQAMIAVLAGQSGAERLDLIAWKDLSPGDEKAFGAQLAEQGFARLGSLPVAVLDLPFSDEAGYLASLSAATRKDIRRKLARSDAVRIEFRSDLDGLEAAIDELYESTRTASGVDYGDLEVLPAGYFGAVSRALGERAVFALYWVGDTLAAFNLLLVEPGRVIDKFLGMRYPLARQHDLYVVSWMANIRFCLERGIRRLQSGQTAYAAKLRFGSRLETSTIHFRHRRAPLQWALRRLSPWLDFERFDPDLSRLGERRAA